MAEFATNVDIGNRALQFCGGVRLSSFADASREAREVAFAYDKLRLVELQRNIWKFATRRVVLRPLDTTTLELVPVAWSATALYVMGSIVVYNGLFYICEGFRVSGTTPDVSTAWVRYYGSMIVNQFTAGTTYNPGELVYTPTSEGYAVYLALVMGTDTPGVFPQWSSTAAYARGQATQRGGTQLLFSPGDAPVFFTPGNLVINGTAVQAQSLRDLNVGNDPLVDQAGWQFTPPVGQPDYMTGLQWLRLDATVQSIVTPYPLTAGPSSDPTSLNAYQLPSGYLRHAPADPKGGLVPGIGANSNPLPSDFVFEGNFIVTGSSDPIMLRFVANVADVPEMDAMFCEGLAARIAEDVGPMLIDKAERNAAMARIRQRYKEVIAEARAVDGVERGATTTPQDPYIACRA